MFCGWWEHQNRRLPLYSGYSPLELYSSLFRTNLDEVALLAPSSAICSNNFILGNWAPSSAFWRLFNYPPVPPAQQLSRNVAFASIISHCIPVLLSILAPSSFGGCVLTPRQ